MEKSKKEQILKSLSKHIQGLAAVVTAHGIKVIGIKGVLYAEGEVYSVITKQNTVELFALTNELTLNNLKDWLGY